MERKKRTRRKPEEARRLILDAARRVFAEVGPDRAGLKRVADAAGVSHGLVTHYFGTFDQLVESTLSAEAEKARSALFPRIAAEPNRAIELYIDAVLEQMTDPLAGRLAAWALLSGRLDADDFFSHRLQGFKHIAGVLEALPGRNPELSRADIEDLIAMVASSAFGYALGRKALWGGLGIKQTAAEDRRFRDNLVRTARERLYGTP